MALMRNATTKPANSSRHTRTEAGFTLVELLLATIITGLVLAGSVATWQVAMRSSRIGGAHDQLESLIDEHLASIEALNERYSCCPGFCSADTSVISAATSCEDKVADGTNDRNYYSPEVVFLKSYPHPDDPPYALWNTFKQACTNGTIADNFIAAFPPIPNHAANPSLSLTYTRTPTLVDPNTHRVQWEYNGRVDGRTVVTRVVDIIPTVASWCP